MEEIIEIEFNSFREVYKKIRYIKPFLVLNDLRISEIVISLKAKKILIYVV
jgi:hypothetical protein